MSLTPKENSLSLSKFESMLKTNSVYFFDSIEFEEIIHYYIDSGKTSLAKKAVVAEKIASLLLVSLPFTFILVKLPAVSLILLLAGLTIMCLPILLHIFTLPVEFDASFNRALPILSEGNYIPDSAMPIARKILSAAALTYVSASLASLLNFYRWLAILRR